jgi:hypothetical protein
MPQEEPEHQTSNRVRDHPILSALIGAVAVIAAAIITVVFAHGGSGGSSPQPSVSYSSSPRPSGQPSASLTYPADNTKMSREQGFTTGGVVKGLGADTIWILDHPAGVYYVDAEAAIDNGKWVALDRPLGNKSDRLPYGLPVVAVFATPEYATQLRHWESVGDVRLGQIPSGCYQFGEVTVDVNRP